VLGRYDDADAYLRQSAAMCDAVDARFFRAQTDPLCGRMLAARRAEVMSGGHAASSSARSWSPRHAGTAARRRRARIARLTRGQPAAGGVGLEGGEPEGAETAAGAAGAAGAVALVTSFPATSSTVTPASCSANAHANSLR